MHGDDDQLVVCDAALLAVARGRVARDLRLDADAAIRGREPAAARHQVRDAAAAARPHHQAPEHAAQRLWLQPAQGHLPGPDVVRADAHVQAGDLRGAGRDGQCNGAGAGRPAAAGERRVGGRSRAGNDHRDDSEQWRQCASASAAR